MKRSGSLFVVAHATGLEDVHRARQKYTARKKFCAQKAATRRSHMEMPGKKYSSIVLEHTQHRKQWLMMPHRDSTISELFHRRPMEFSTCATGRRTKEQNFHMSRRTSIKLEMRQAREARGHVAPKSAMWPNWITSSANSRARAGSSPRISSRALDHVSSTSASATASSARLSVFWKVEPSASMPSLLARMVAADETSIMPCSSSASSTPSSFRPLSSARFSFSACFALRFSSALALRAAFAWRTFSSAAAGLRPSIHGMMYSVRLPRSCCTTMSDAISEAVMSMSLR
mmetsp:Transcript_1900/g.6616  ORF Transcript_1900/g.6616 Transcript_1900/m.6616 type:complete len:288 (-) Transcript_1900:3239-4102(-)